MLYCVECGKPREIGRRRCKECSNKRRNEMNKKSSSYINRIYNITLVCEACGLVFNSFHKTSRICSKCRKLIKSLCDSTNNYEYKWTSDGEIWNHRRIAKEMLQRPLTRTEVVHHLDLNPKNNTLSNLAVMSRGDHSKLHQILNVDRVIYEKKLKGVTTWKDYCSKVTEDTIKTCNLKILYLSEV